MDGVADDDGTAIRRNLKRGRKIPYKGLWGLRVYLSDETRPELTANRTSPDTSPLFSEIDFADSLTHAAEHEGETRDRFDDGASPYN
jgi:hypothetical protein